MKVKLTCPMHRNGITFFLLLTLFNCHYSRKLPVTSYYEYDRELPLQTKLILYKTEDQSLEIFKVEFQSTHQQKVSGILSYPVTAQQPLPVIILIHGLWDRKEVDYIERGARLLNDAGFAVLRLDLYNHGQRQLQRFDFSFDGSTRYQSREMITQSVFDIRRAIDFLGTLDQVDANRIGYMGISLGGIIGTIVTSVDARIKVPVIVLAGGNINLMFGLKAWSGQHKNYLGVMDPINFVDQIAPRPLLMLNAENDEVVPPITSKLLYKKARQPKQIIWYPAKHKTIPVLEVYQEGIQWFQKYL